MRVREIIVTEDKIYHRIETKSQTPDTARLQIEKQEIWGRPCQNFYYSDIPKVKAFLNQLPTRKDLPIQERGIEFTTKAEPDRCVPPPFVFWSGDRDGVRTEDGYAKIKVEITDCNQIEDWRSYERTSDHSKD